MHDRQKRSLCAWLSAPKGVCLVYGPTGVGKSHLVAEALGPRAHVRVPDITDADQIKVAKECRVPQQRSLFKLASKRPREGSSDAIVVLDPFDNIKLEDKMKELLLQLCPCVVVITTKLMELPLCSKSKLVNQCVRFEPPEMSEMGPVLRERMAYDTLPEADRKIAGGIIRACQGDLSWALTQFQWRGYNLERRVACDDPRTICKDLLSARPRICEESLSKMVQADVDKPRALLGPRASMNLAMAMSDLGVMYRQVPESLMLSALSQTLALHANDVLLNPFDDDNNWDVKPVDDWVKLEKDLDERYKKWPKEGEHLKPHVFTMRYNKTRANGLCAIVEKKTPNSSGTGVVVDVFF